jgi:hypothetical protein
VISQIGKEQLEAHKKALEELYLLDSETAESQFLIAQFILKHPKLAGLAYPAADILRKEQDKAVGAVAVRTVEEEMVKRRDATSPTFNLSRRRLSENQIKKIIHQLRADEKPSRDSTFSPTPKKLLECPHCHNSIPNNTETRKEVVSFRTTENTEDAISYLAQQYGVSRSHLVNELLTVKRRFGCALQKGD